MPSVDIRMPEEQKEGTEAFLGAWLKHRGETVEENEPLVEISTDKVTIEIAAPASGVLEEIFKTDNDPVQPGELLGRIQTGAFHETHQGNSEPGSTAQTAISDANSGSYSPVVRQLLREHDLDPTQVPTSGHSGRLTRQDVMDFLSRREAGPPTPLSPQPEKFESKPEAKLVCRMVAHSPMRRSIASHMIRSVQAAPHVTAVFEADLSRVLADRETCKASSNGEDVPSVTAYMLRAAVQAIHAVPEVNSKWHEDAIEIFDDVNLGFGAALENGGLVVPVIHRAQTLEFAELARRLRELTGKARSGKLTREDVDGGTFTISNHGVGGSLLAAPIILSHGQAAILGVGKLQRRAVVAEQNGKDLLRIRPMVYVTLTVDHRVLDGQQTNAFMTEFVRALELG